jgi:hypothetical protein
MFFLLALFVFFLGLGLGYFAAAWIRSCGTCGRRAIICLDCEAQATGEAKLRAFRQGVAEGVERARTKRF